MRRGPQPLIIWTMFPKIYTEIKKIRQCVSSDLNRKMPSLRCAQAANCGLIDQMEPRNAACEQMFWECRLVFEWFYFNTKRKRKINELQNIKENFRIRFV